MPSHSLEGKRVLITHANAFMGPVLCEVFAEHGATVIANTDSLLSPEAPAAMVDSAGPLDVVVANLAIAAPTTAATEVAEAEWRDTFALITTAYVENKRGFLRDSEFAPRRPSAFCDVFTAEFKKIDGVINNVQLFLCNTIFSANFVSHHA